jgi:hypothetical protein
VDKTLLLGILFAVIITVSLTVSPAFSATDKKLTTEFSLPDIESAVLKDVVEANGKNAYWELTATLDGNLVQSTKDLEGDSKGAGVMIKPDNDHVYTVGVHTYNNCVNFDCSNYKVHGHVSRLAFPSSAICSNAGYEFESIPGSVQDLGTGHITYKTGQDKTIIRLVKINATLNEVADSEPVCDNSANPNVGQVYLYNTQVIEDSGNNYLCVHLSEPETLKNTSINGFTSTKTPSLC